MSFYTNREVVSLGLRLQNVVHRFCDGDVGLERGIRVGFAAVDRALGRADVAPLFVLLARVEANLPRVLVALVLLDKC